MTTTTTTTELEREVTGVHRLAEGVHGWLTPGEGQLLYTLARTTPPAAGVIVEIGSWKGKSTIYLATGSIAGPQLPVYAIDPHVGSQIHQEMFGKVATFEDFKQNIAAAGVAGIVRPLVMTSNQAAQTFSQPVSLLFIDGEHGYESVREDFHTWSPKVVDGGRIAFHDSRKPGPRQLIREAVLSSREFSDLYSVDSITVVSRVARNSALDRLRNQVAFRTYLLKKRSL